MKNIHKILFLGMAATSVAGLAVPAFAQNATKKTDLVVNESTAAGSKACSPEKLQWFRDAKFGMFIHWGLFSIPGGVWEGKRGSFVMNEFQVPVRTYEKLAEQFQPANFDADAWGKLARDAGMKYICFTAKHHEGFAMYASKASPYNVVDATPWHHDPIKDLAAACQKYGLKLCLYYSHVLDWHEADGFGNTWDFGPDDKKDFDRYMQSKAVPQIKEILTQYGPIGMVWFDVPGSLSEARSKAFYDLVHSLQPDCLVNSRVGAGYGDYRVMPDNVLPSRIFSEAWETAAIINHSWGFRINDTDFKSAKTLLHNLVDVTSKGGNYLLNVGPTAEGIIPRPEVDGLEAVGRWMKGNSASIYDTQPVAVTSPQWGRVTMKPGTLYLHVFDWPADGKLVLDGPTNAVTKAWLLSDPGRKALEASVDDGVLTVHLSGNAPDPDDSVVVVEYQGDLKIKRHPLRQGDDGSLALDIVNSKFDATEFWPRSYTWEADITKPGRYRVDITYVTRGENTAHPVKFGIENGPSISMGLPRTHVYNHSTVPAGIIDIPSAGLTKFQLLPGAGETFVNYILFEKVELKPVE